jgi:hypothetical protein
MYDEFAAFLLRQMTPVFIIIGRSQNPCQHLMLQKNDMVHSVLVFNER